MQQAYCVQHSDCVSCSRPTVCSSDCVSCSRPTVCSSDCVSCIGLLCAAAAVFHAAGLLCEAAAVFHAVGLLCAAATVFHAVGLLFAAAAVFPEPQKRYAFTSKANLWIHNSWRQGNDVRSKRPKPQTQRQGVVSQKIWVLKQTLPLRHYATRCVLFQIFELSTFSKYNRTPPIRTNRQGELSGYAEISDNWMFLWKIGYICSLSGKK